MNNIRHVRCLACVAAGGLCNVVWWTMVSAHSFLGRRRKLGTLNSKVILRRHAGDNLLSVRYIPRIRMVLFQELPEVTACACKSEWRLVVATVRDAQPILSLYSPSYMAYGVGSNT